MRKRNFLILLLLSRLWPVIGVSAQDAWKITAEQIEPSSYYGITVANGMLGLVSSPDPLKISRVVLGGLYDIYGKGRVNNFLHGINMLDTELQINGTTVKASQISGYKQTLDMRQGLFCGEFDYQSLAHIEYQYTALRHLPYSCLLRVRIVPKENIEVAVANILTVHESLRSPQESFNRIFNGKTAIDRGTSPYRNTAYYRRTARRHSRIARRGDNEHGSRRSENLYSTLALQRWYARGVRHCRPLYRRCGRSGNGGRQIQSGKRRRSAFGNSVLVLRL